MNRRAAEVISTSALVATVLLAGAAADAPAQESAAREAGARRALAQQAPSQQASLDARPGDRVDVYHGVRVPEPWAWMEDMSAEPVMEWARAQDRRARSFIGVLDSRDRILEAVRAAADHERYLRPVVRGDRYFYGRTNSSFTRVSLLMRQGPSGAETLLVDADALAARGLTADRSFWPSPDGSVLAWGAREEGSRWMEIRFVEVATGRELSDRIRGLQGQRLSRVSWAADGSGVWYDGFELPPEEERQSARLTGSRVAFHRLGTEQSQDVVALRADDEGQMLIHESTDDGRWVVVRVMDGRSLQRMLVLDGEEARSGEARPRVLLDRPSQATFQLVGGQDGHLWFYTTQGAPNGRVVSIPVDDARPERWTEVLPEQDDAIDSWVGVDAAGQGLVAGFRNDGLLELRYFEPGQSQGRTIPLARTGSIWFGVSGRQGHPDIYYLLSGFADPGTVYRHDLATAETEAFLRPELPYDPDDFVIRQVFYPTAGRDSVPMYLAHHRSVEPDGSRPVMMYGYGFLGWSASPWFRPHMAQWFQRGGVFALPAIRGGGEFGQEWARAGIRLNRQNAIDDYVAAAEWLVDEGLASPELLVAETNSAGASVVGAALIQRPDLFGAGILAFPLLDVLSYHKFTGGARWAGQLGTVEDPDEFRALLEYSPVHNVDAGRCYPPTLVLPGEEDETTPPFHAYKFVAALQHAQSCENPVLLRMAWGAGHAYGRDQATTLDSFADQIGFLVRVLGLE